MQVNYWFYSEYIYSLRVFYMAKGMCTPDHHTHFCSILKLFLRSRKHRHCMLLHFPLLELRSLTYNTNITRTAQTQH